MSQPALITSFKRYWRALGRAESTGDGYGYAIARLALQHDLNVVTYDQLADYVAVRLRDVSPETAVMDVRAFRSFFAWMVEEEERDDNPARRLKHPRIDESPVTVANDTDLKRLLGTCAKSTKIGRRDAAALSLIARSGLRRGEVVVLDLAHLNLDERAVLVPKTKVGKPRLVPLHHETIALLDRWLRSRGVEAGPLFTSMHGGGRLKANSLGQMFERRCEQAQITDLTAHAFRRAFASWWLSEGGSEVGLQAVAGWKSTEMISRYTRMDRERLAIDEFRRLAG